MGIFSKLFSKNTEKNSHIRRWVIQEIEQVDTAQPDGYTLFVGLIHAAIQWGTEEKNHEFSQVSTQYLGDATIFEIACYTYYRAESWLNKNQPEFTAEITFALKKWIVEKFYTTLYADQQRVTQLVEERLNDYRRIIGEGKELDDLYLALEQRIVMTKGDKFDKRDQSPNSISIPLDSQYINSSLIKYEESYIPTVIVSMQDYCDKNPKQQTSQKVHQLQGQGQQDYLYGMALLAQKDWVRACKAFTKVIDADPTHYDALVQRGLLYVIQHQPVEAVQDFTAAIEANPNKAAAYLHRGTCFHQNFRQKETALDDYTMAIKLAPQLAAGYFGRGLLYDKIALYEEQQALENKDDAAYADVTEAFLGAINDYGQVIALEPDHDDAYANRGLVYARKARANKNVDFMTHAIDDIEKAISLNWEHGHLFKQQDEMKELLEQISQTDGKASLS